MPGATGCTFLGFAPSLSVEASASSRTTDLRSISTSRAAGTEHRGLPTPSSAKSRRPRLLRRRCGWIRPRPSPTRPSCTAGAGGHRHRGGRRPAPPRAKIGTREVQDAPGPGKGSAGRSPAARILGRRSRKSAGSAYFGGPAARRRGPRLPPADRFRDQGQARAAAGARPGIGGARGEHRHCPSSRSPRSTCGCRRARASSAPPSNAARTRRRAPWSPGARRSPKSS